jgi:peptidoglycan hydrolase-like amidase
MADAGRSFMEILKHHYQGIEVSEYQKVNLR